MKKMTWVLCVALAMACILSSIPFALAEPKSLGSVTATDVFTTPTDVSPVDILYGDVYEDEQINAKDALWVLKYCVGKTELTAKQLEVADVSYQVYRTEKHLGIDAKDALVILQYSAGTGPFRITFPVEFTSYDVTTREEYSWEVSSVENYPSALCRTYDEFTAYLQTNHLPQEWASAYSPAFFETNSLFLFEGIEPCRGDFWTVEEMRHTGKELWVTVKWHSWANIDVAGCHLYRVTLNDPLQLKGIERGVLYRDDYSNEIKRESIEVYS